MLGQTPEDQTVVDALINRDYPPRLVQIAPDRRADAAARLMMIQPSAKGRLSQEVAFLLASLGYDYGKNRDRLLAVLRRCGTDQPAECDEDTVALVIGLYASGHTDVLQALVDAGARKPDGALAESLGTFYFDVLKTNAAALVDRLKSVDQRGQNGACRLAGRTDGSGINSDDLNKVAAQMQKIGGDIASRCLRQIEEANKPLRGGQ